jgi:hypothetical protein
MLFFGSYGSVLPYIVYLSLMWICILIGIRGQFKSFLGFHNVEENKIESVTSIVQHDDRLAHFFEITVKQQTQATVAPMALFLCFGFTPVIDNIFHQSIYHGSPIYAHIIDACGLRAPPKANLSRII